MIVSHSHRFVLVQVPQTGSTAIGRYLLDNVECVSVMNKHATLQDAQRELGSAIKGYTVVASVRHPLDVVVSSYHKARTDHHVELAEPGAPAKRSGARKEERIRWASEDGAGLDDFVAQFVRHTYAPVWLPSMRAADHVLRFETLSDDFDRCRAVLGCAGGPPLARTNVTDRPRSDPGDLLATPARERLAQVLGPFLDEWSYELPQGWPDPDTSLRRTASYRLSPRLKLARRWLAGTATGVPAHRRLVAKVRKGPSAG